MEAFSQWAVHKAGYTSGEQWEIWYGWTI